MIVAAASNSSGLTLACKPGITKKTFARKTSAILRPEAAKLKSQLTAWAERQGLSVSGVGFEDPDAKPPRRGRTTIIQSKSYGTVLQVETSNRSDTALVTVENNCWAPKKIGGPIGRRSTDSFRVEDIGRTTNKAPRGTSAMGRERRFGTSDGGAVGAPLPHQAPWRARATTCAV
jgi:hypothetical protein